MMMIFVDVTSGAAMLSWRLPVATMWKGERGRKTLSKRPRVRMLVEMLGGEACRE